MLDPAIRYTLDGGCVLSIQRADITTIEADAIVNAANHSLLGGGGVDGAIHRAAGKELLAACRALPRLGVLTRCPVGEARITPGFKLPARYVIHTVGPIYPVSRQPEAQLRAAYESSLALARAHGLERVFFPAISCGAFAFPVRPAARVALAACVQGAEGFRELGFALFEARTVQAWTAEAEALLGAPD
ncbi:MAG: macro domain-containing protein [Alphaproteobacteria bacterium]|nr:macro domain-containing protein [Alphaproteobacteria bacterium]